jgi:T5orf172 domain
MTVYILRASPSGRIKIGISDDFPKRLSQIRRGNSENIEVLRAFHDNDAVYIRRLERELHEELSGVCDHHEWFYGGSETELIIERLDRQFNREQSAIQTISIEDQ